MKAPRRAKTSTADLSHQVYEELGSSMMLRVVPLAGELGGYLAAFIETAVTRYRSQASGTTLPSVSARFWDTF
jgi:hypothetical protein